jgi:riboflavin kinase/FMN adenylyltransferase
MKVRLGVYSGHAKIEGNPLGLPQRVPLKGINRWKAAIVIGPIDKTGLPKIEAHLINFKGNLYGKKIILSLEKYIRPFKKFLSADVLKRQIAKDIKEIKKLGNYGK